MTQFRPCIDIHEGKVKQIVGSTLHSNPVTNFVAELPPSYYANLFRISGLEGAHVIMLDDKSKEAAMEALETYLGGLQVGGGINIDNAEEFLDNGAEKVIVTSYIFPNGSLDTGRLAELGKRIGKDRIVVDLSCIRVSDGDRIRWKVVRDRWKNLTDFELTSWNLSLLADMCSEFLVHSVTFEGKRRGIDEELIRLLASCTDIPATYAGGASSISDLYRVKEISGGTVDLTIGSGLDIFGGDIKFDDCVKFNKENE